MNTSLLKKALIGNIAFSSLFAILSFLFAEASTAINQMANGNGLTFGIQLLVFAAVMLFIVLGQKFTAPYIYTIVILDILFVLGTVVRFLVDRSFTVQGYLLTGFCSLIVLCFAIAQWRGYLLLNRKSTSSDN